MVRLKVTEIDKIHLDNNNLKRPMTPSQWCGEASYIPVLCVYMTAGGGIGGNYWCEIIKDFSFAGLYDFLVQGLPAVATTWDDRKIVLNLKYMVKAEPATLLTRVFKSDNFNYEKGYYTYFRLIPSGEKATFID